MKSPTQRALDYVRSKCPGFVCGCCGGRSFHLIQGEAFVPESGDSNRAMKVISLWCQDCAHLHSFLQNAGDGHPTEAA
jgi:hypothetical protein